MSRQSSSDISKHSMLLIIFCVDDVRPEKGYGLPEDEAMGYLHRLHEEFGCQFTLLIPANWEGRCDIKEHSEWVKNILETPYFEAAADGYFHYSTSSKLQGRPEFCDLTLDEAEERIQRILETWKSLEYRPNGFCWPAWGVQPKLYPVVGRHFDYLIEHSKVSGTIDYMERPRAQYDYAIDELDYAGQDLLVLHSHIAGSGYTDTWTEENYEKVRSYLRKLTQTHQVIFSQLHELAVPESRSEEAQQSASKGMSASPTSEALSSPMPTPRMSPLETEKDQKSFTEVLEKVAIPNSPSMNILLFPSTVTDIWTRGFRRRHNVMTVGFKLNDAAVTEFDIFYSPEKDTIQDIFDRLPEGWSPDVCFISSVDYNDFPLGLEACPCPIVANFSDYNLCFDVMQRSAPFIDLIIANDLELIEPLKASGANQVAYLPWFALDEENFKPLDLERDIDVLFVGNLNPHVQRARGKILEKMQRWGGRNGRFAMMTGVYGDDYIRLLNRSKIIFNHSVRGDLNMRLFETMGCEALAVLEASNKPALACFRHGEEIVYYDEKNLIETIEWWLAHPEERFNVARQGREKCLSHHTYFHRAEAMLEVCHQYKIFDKERPKRAIEQFSKGRHLLESATVMMYQGKHAAAMNIARQAGEEESLANDVSHLQGIIMAQRALLGASNRTELAQEALRFLRTASEEAPHDLILRWNLDFIQRALGIHEAGFAEEDDLTVSSKPFPFLPIGYKRERIEWERGLMQYAMDPSEGKRALKRLLDWNRFLIKGNEYLNSGQKKEAADHFNKATQLMPDDGYAWYRLGLSLKKDDVKQAIIAFCKASDLEPFFFDARLELAQLLFDSYLHKDSLKLIEDSMALATGPYQAFEEKFQDIQSKVQKALAMEEESKTEEGASTAGWKPDPVLFKIAHYFEGDADSIRILQRRWVDTFKGCKRALDLGCGEGLFLQALKEIGVPGEGVDLDPEKVIAAHQQGIVVHEQDIMSFLADKEGEYDGVFASHIVEHFSGTDAIAFLKACHRAIKPGSPIVLITPNWRNSIVVQEVFWLDVTHVRPYPAALLEGMLKAIGFDVQQSGALEEGLNDTFIVGRKC